MAKRQKKKAFSIQGYDAEHYKTTDAYTRAVANMYQRATNDVAMGVAKLNIDPNKPFQFSDYPSAQATLKRVTAKLAKQVTAVITEGSRKQWLFACKKNDEFVASIMDTSKLSKARLGKMQDRNLDSLKIFQDRKVDGMNLAQRVWKYTDQFKAQIEAGLDVGLGEGRSAQQLSRDLRVNLNDPNRLFRRVRDKYGNLQLSKNAKAFHPGVGVYRSSAKNAMRLTRSEVNMAYREADWLRWQQLDFVIGFEVHRTNHDPQCKCKLCDRLVGRYPKTFKFKGWHPQCMCYVTPILTTEEDFDAQELSDLKSALHGTQYKKLAVKQPDFNGYRALEEWAKENQGAQANWGSTPYFIRDNFQGGVLSNGLISPIQQQPINRAVSTSTVDVPHKAMKLSYPTPKAVNETLKVINAEFSHDRWFEHGDCILTPTYRDGVNGETSRDGRISLKPQRLDCVLGAMSKIGRGKSADITFDEADAMATFWHEITHNRNLPGVTLRDMKRTSTQTDIMEMMNEFVARKTLPDFYSKLGCAKTPFPEFINSRASTGYNRRVLGYDYVIEKLGLNKDLVLESAKKNLFSLNYCDQEVTAVQALIDGGINKYIGSNNKKVNKTQTKKIVALCRRGMGVETIEEFLKAEGII